MRLSFCFFPSCVLPTTTWSSTPRQKVVDFAILYQHNLILLKNGSEALRTVAGFAACQLFRIAEPSPLRVALTIAHRSCRSMGLSLNQLSVDRTDGQAAVDPAIKRLRIPPMSKGSVQLRCRAVSCQNQPNCAPTLSTSDEQMSRPCSYSCAVGRFEAQGADRVAG